MLDATGTLSWICWQVDSGDECDWTSFEDDDGRVEAIDAVFLWSPAK